MENLFGEVEEVDNDLAKDASTIEASIQRIEKLVQAQSVALSKLLDITTQILNLVQPPEAASIVLTLGKPIPK